MKMLIFVKGDIQLTIIKGRGPGNLDAKFQMAVVHALHVGYRVAGYSYRDSSGH